MTKLYEQIRKDLLVARKNKSDLKGELVLLVSDIDARAKETKTEPTDEIIYAAVNKAVKNLDDQLETATDKDKLQATKQHLSGYLPEQLDGAKLIEAIEDMIKNNPTAKMGQVIGLMKKEYGASVDGRTLSQTVKGFF